MQQEYNLCQVLAARSHAEKTGIAVEVIQHAQRVKRRCPPDQCVYSCYRVRPYHKDRMVLVCRVCLHTHACLGLETCKHTSEVTEDSSVVCKLSGVQIGTTYAAVHTDRERTTLNRGVSRSRKRDHDDMDADELSGGDAMDVTDGSSIEFSRWLDEVLKKDSSSAKRSRSTKSSAASAAPMVGRSKVFSAYESSSGPSAYESSSGPREDDAQRTFRQAVEVALRTNATHLNLQLGEAQLELASSISAFLWGLKSKGNDYKPHDVLAYDVVAVLYLLSQGLHNAISGVRIIPKLKEMTGIKALKAINKEQRQAGGRKRGRAAAKPASSLTSNPPLSLRVSTIKDVRKRIIDCITSRSQNPAYNDTSLIFPKLKTLTEAK